MSDVRCVTSPAWGHPARCQGPNPSSHGRDAASTLLLAIGSARAMMPSVTDRDREPDAYPPLSVEDLEILEEAVVQLNDVVQMASGRMDPECGITAEDQVRITRNAMADAGKVLTKWRRKAVEVTDQDRSTLAAVSLRHALRDAGLPEDMSPGDAVRRLAAERDRARARAERARTDTAYRAEIQRRIRAELNVNSQAVAVSQEADQANRLVAYLTADMQRIAAAVGWPEDMPVEDPAELLDAVKQLTRRAAQAERWRLLACRSPVTDEDVTRAGVTVGRATAWLGSHPAWERIDDGSVIGFAVWRRDGGSVLTLAGPARIADMINSTARADGRSQWDVLDEIAAQGQGDSRRGGEA